MLRSRIFNIPYVSFNVFLENKILLKISEFTASDIFGLNIYKMGFDATKPVFGVCDQVRLKLVSTAT